jgi:hypothetical protein
VYRWGSLINTINNKNTTTYLDNALTANTSASYEITVLSSDDLEGPKSAAQVKWSQANVPGDPAVSGDWDIVNRYHEDITVNLNNNSSITKYAVTIDSEGYGNYWVQQNGYLDTTPYWSADTVG